MAYCLRALPLDAVALIEEMRSHWVDLAGLRAAGGTPSARCLKAFEITQSRWDGLIFVRAIDPSRDHVRRCHYTVANPCRLCAKSLRRWIGADIYCDTCIVRPTHVKIYMQTVNPFSNIRESLPRELWGPRL